MIGKQGKILKLKENKGIVPARTSNPWYRNWTYVSSTLTDPALLEISEMGELVDHKELISPHCRVQFSDLRPS